EEQAPAGKLRQNREKIVRCESEAAIRAAEAAPAVDVLRPGVLGSMHDDQPFERVGVVRIEPAEPNRSAITASVPFPSDISAAAGGVGTRHVREPLEEAVVLRIGSGTMGNTERSDRAAFQIREVKARQGGMGAKVRNTRHIPAP